MGAWRSTTSAFLVLALAGSVSAQTFQLAETPKVDDYFRVHLDMKLTGELRITRDGVTVPLPLKATAAHDFPERLLIVGTDGIPKKSARWYESAKATISLDKDTNERSLRAERRLLVAQREKGQYLVYCPTGTLTRPELELTSEHFDTLALPGLLPGKAVAIGATWKLTPAVAQSLCNFDGLTAHDITCELKSVQDEVASIVIAGTAAGIDVGALVKLTITGSCRFDLKTHRLVALDWTQTDERDQGPASPAGKMETTTSLTRTPIDEVPGLNDVTLVSVPEGFDVPTELTNLGYNDPKNRFEVAHVRDWQMVSGTEERAVFRLLDRGDFVAQASITAYPRAKDGKHTAPEEFQQALKATLGWELEQTLQAGEIPVENGRWVYRLSTSGQMDGIPVVQNCYLIASPDGEQVLVAFMMTPKQVEKLGARDLRFVEGVSFKK